MNTKAKERIEYFEDKIARLELLEVKVMTLEAERKDALDRAEEATSKCVHLQAQLDEQQCTLTRSDRKIEKLSTLSRQLTRENGDLTAVFLFFFFIFMWKQYTTKLDLITTIS